MTTDFFRFPSTPHLALLGGLEVRDDKVFTARERGEFLRNQLIVEEKVDGANLGISFDPDGNIRVQNRGDWLRLPGPGQWKGLQAWLAPRTDALFEVLVDRYILFGEWCYARHSVFYDSLPDWFLGFDIYDRQSGRFLSVQARARLCTGMNLVQVPVLARGRFQFRDLPGLLSGSRFSDRPAEGVYLRHDRGEWLERRAKLVCPTFIQSMEQHWSRSGIKPNRLSSEVVG